MATRYYITRKTPNAIIHGPMDGTWNTGDGEAPYGPCRWAYRIQTTKTTDGGSNLNLTFSTNKQSNYDFPFSWRWMTYPLEAQTILGTFDMCFIVYTAWNGEFGQTNEAVLKYKVHVYLADGQSVTPKTVLLDNYVDATTLPNSITHVSLTSAQTLTSAVAVAGDIIVIEMGFRVVSSPTPTPTYPPSQFSQAVFYSLGADPARPDAIPGSLDGISYDPWFEFSDTITTLALPDPPANDACADAVNIASIPATTAYVDSTQSTDFRRAVWWKFVAPTTGILNITAHGTNYNSAIKLYTGTCEALSQVADLDSGERLAAHRSQAFIRSNVTKDVQYYVKIEDFRLAGGLGRLNLFYQPATYQDDDIFLANMGIFVFRNSQIINWGGDWGNYAPTGIGIDYTRRPLVSIQDESTHTGERLLIGLHDYELVEIADLYNLNSELDFIGDPWNILTSIHPAQMHVTQAGFIHQAWFGNGYLIVAGSGSLPAFLSTISSDTAYSALKSIDAISADDQPGTPFTDTVRVLDVEITAPWAIAFNETTNILYYTSGGLYFPVGGNTIKRYNIATNTQLADFATVTLTTCDNPGLKGLALLPDGGLLVCNGTVVSRLNSSGTVTQTYTPSIAQDSQTLVDVVLAKDGLSFWTVDLLSTRLFHFTLSTGVETLTFQPYGTPGSLLQMVLYGVDAPVIPAPPDISGIYYINPTKTTKHDSYYSDTEKKIPNPTIRTGLIGE